MAFSFYKTFTTDHTQCGTANSTDYPITIWVTDADLKTVGNGGKVQNASGFDIRPYSDSALTSALTFELVFYDGANGILEMHVKVATLSNTIDLMSYLAFGDASLSTDGSSTATWNTGFVGVYHLPNGTTLTTLDSTSHANNGSNTGTTAGTGQLDGGGVFNTAAQITTGHDSSLDLTGSFTLSVWMKPATVTSGSLAQMWQKNNANVTTVGILQDNADFIGQTTSGSLTKINVFSASTWFLAVFTFDGTTQTLYSNGTNLASQNRSPIGSTGTADACIGLDLVNGRGFNGTLDEVRISNVARDANWITAEYNNQKASSTFLTWGSLTPVSGGAVVVLIRS